jgi:hypothetical protein
MTQGFGILLLSGNIANMAKFPPLATLPTLATLDGAAMGKRSSFPRREADFYPTPPSAVLPLLPYLCKIRMFAEPCAGASDLVRALEQAGLVCTYLGDIRSGNDALARDSYGAIDAIITNPPHSREILHRLIAHFPAIAPTWLLIEADCAHTR